MRLRSVRQLKNLYGKRIMVRVDFNVTVERGRVPRSQLVRLRRALPTIEWLRRAGARSILVTHFGRPAGRKVSKFSTKPIAEALSKLIRTRVKFVSDVAGPRARRAARTLRPGEILMLENVRFHRGEEQNDQTFARALAALADLFVNDAFAASHRAHASVVGITKFLPSSAGLLLESEVSHLSKLLGKPRRPFIVIMGGAKISTKIPVIRHLLPRADAILIGGALANTFFRARGYSTGRSLVDQRSILTAHALLRSGKIQLPVDLRAMRERQQKIPIGKFRWRPVVRKPDTIGAREQVMDIGPETIRRFTDEIRRAQTIVWNGPVGVVENPRFARGTIALARALARRARAGAFVVVGGGDTIPIVERHFSRVPKTHYWISTGGGAMLEYLSGKPLPSLRPLTKI